MKRRQFLTAVSAATGVVLSGPRLLWALDPDNAYRKAIGIQLYTLRNEIGSDVASTIAAVAKAGYRQVEPYGFPDCQAMIDAAKDNGLAIHSSHFNSDCLIKPDGDAAAFESILDKAKDAGLSHLVIPYLGDQYRKTLDDYRRLCESFNGAAEKAKAAGIQLAYHNHAFEFQPLEGDQCGYDIMMDQFTPEMKFEVDVFWVVVGGLDPVELIGKLKGRVSQLHLKDLKTDIETPSYGGVPNDAFEELGDGKVAIEPIIVAAADAGVAHCHVEQDQSPAPLESVTKSIRYLKTL